MNEATWELVPMKGVKRDGLELFFGAQRAAVRAWLEPMFGAPESPYPNEDDYRAAGGGTFIRLRFDDDALQDVEFLGGDLRFDGIPLHRHATWSMVEAELARRGYAFTRARILGDGRECGALGVNIATREEVGGDGDGIEWVIASVNIL